MVGKIERKNDFAKGTINLEVSEVLGDALAELAALSEDLLESDHPVPEIFPVGIQLARSWFPGLVPWFLQALPQVFDYRLAMMAGMTGNGPQGHSLLLQLVKIHNILQCQHV